MSQSVDVFLYLLWHADTLVWCIAFLLSLIAGLILHNYSDDFLLSVLTATALFVSIMAANVAFTLLGVMFTTSKNSNVVAAAGAAVCSVTVIALVTLRLLGAIAEYSNRLKGEGTLDHGN